MKTNPRKIRWWKHHFDARTVQHQLEKLAVTIALKVEREGIKRIKPQFAAIDIYVMIRQATTIYNLFHFINADERRKKDPDWRVGYSAAILPLIRSEIDCLYNITAILTNPGPKGYQFRESGYKKLLASLDADEKLYAGKSDWDSYIAVRRIQISVAMQADGVTMAEVQRASIWPTLSRFLCTPKGTNRTAQQDFLSNLAFGFWDEYSGMSHATFQGLLPTAFFFTPDDLPHKYRPAFETSNTDQMISYHYGRVAGILICILTEIQAYFRFDGANINQRLHDVWDALRKVPEVKELYDKRYRKLIRDRGIAPN